MLEKGRMVSHPGVYIKDAIDELGLSQSEFALRTGLSIKNVSTIINGESNITFEVAVKLAGFFHNSVEGWVNLQTKYDLYLNQKNKEAEYNEDWIIAKDFDRHFICDYLQINFDAKNKEKTIDEMRRVFNVALLKNLKHPDMYAFCRTSVMKDIDEKTIILRNAWISLAEQKAREIKCEEFNKDAIISGTDYLKSLTLKRPEVFEPELKSFLSKCGVKLVILPFLSGSNVSGVTKWLNNEKCALVAVNDCGKDADRIWFAIFHELGHAIKNHKRHLTISYNKGNVKDEEELEADAFASNALINENDYRDFIKEEKFDISDIELFAKKQKVAPFIVIGRLQKGGLIPWSSFQRYKIKYTIDF